MSKRFDDSVILQIQAGVFMQKLQSVFEQAITADKISKPEKKWEFVKEQLIEFIQEVDINKIDDV